MAPFQKAAQRVGPSKGWEESSNDQTSAGFSAFAVGDSNSCARQKTNDVERSLAGGAAIHARDRRLVRAREHCGEGLNGRAGQLDRRQGESLGRPVGVPPGVLEPAESGKTERGATREIRRQQRRDVRQVRQQKLE